MRLYEFVTNPKPLLVEGIEHPEDKIFDGVAAAKQAVAGITAAGNAKTPKSVKWDGFPAVIFGRNIDGQLVVADKHMFDKKDGIGRVTSPQAFRQYDINRGADRKDLYGKMDVLYAALEKIIPDSKNTRNKFFWGDLLWAQPLKPQAGFYVFKPNTVTYKVKADSPIGKRIGESVAGIAVHTFIPGIGEPDQPLAGLGGLPDRGPVMFFTGDLPQKSKIKINADGVAQVNAVIAKYGTAVDKFMSDLTAMKAKGLLGIMRTYITSKIASGSLDNMVDDFYKYAPSKLSPKAQEVLLGDGQGWLYKEGAAGVVGIWSIWVAITQLKLSIKQQLDQEQNTGDIQAYTGDTVGGEGYVVGGGADKLKLIDRLGFSRANFAKNS